MFYHFRAQDKIHLVFLHQVLCIQILKKYFFAFSIDTDILNRLIEQRLFDIYTVYLLKSKIRNELAVNTAIATDIQCLSKVADDFPAYHLLHQVGKQVDPQPVHIPRSRINIIVPGIENFLKRVAGITIETFPVTAGKIGPGQVLVISHSKLQGWPKVRMKGVAASWFDYFYTGLLIWIYMCGIAGFIDRSINHGDAGLLMEKMLLSIRHRGPDNSSIHQIEEVTFGHNRLTIIDLSESSNQPMTIGNITIVFNGEIYNYLEVKKELVDKGITFHTQGDTEVIIQSFNTWGAECVKKFVGMWAFALWDGQKKELFCSRDRFGIKPFLYMHAGEKFYFASEVKPLKLSGIFSNNLNLEQVSRGLQMGWVAFEDQTYFEKIKALPEASNLFFKDGKIRVEKYWDLKPTDKSGLSFEDKRQRFYELFADSIKLHMRSDVEVGGCLSGGIDSSAITSMVGKLYPDVDFKTFSIFYEGEMDERPWIRSVTEKYPHILNYDYSPSKDALKECFHRMSYHLDVPSNWSSDISQYYVMELAAKHKMKVLLDGQGSDEFLGGYLHSFYRLIGEDMKNLRLGKMFRELNQHARMREFSLAKAVDVFMKSGMSALMNEQQLYATEYHNFLPRMLQSGNGTVPFHLEKKFGNKLDNFFYHLIFHSMLPSLLHFEDRNSMAFSIESRVPFLDHRLVEFGFTLDNEDRIHDGTTKFILREAVRDIIPEAVYQRRDKKGFSTPGASWLRGDMQFLLDQDFSKSEMLDQKKVRQVMKEFQNGNDRLANLVWRICGLNYWITNFV